MSNTSVSVFKTCIKGHETTEEEHFIYDALNRRLCRQCTMESNSTKKRKRL